MAIGVKNSYYIGMAIEAAGMIEMDEAFTCDECKRNDGDDESDGDCLRGLIDIDDPFNKKVMMLCDDCLSDTIRAGGRYLVL